MDQIIANDGNRSLIVANRRGPQILIMHIHNRSSLLNRELDAARAPATSALARLWAWLRPGRTREPWPAAARPLPPEGLASLLFMAALPVGCTASAALDSQPERAALTAPPAQLSPAPPVLARDPSQPETVVAFWREAGPKLWFAKDPAFDQRFRERFLPEHEAAMRGELMAWMNSPEGALALVILLDQFPRNAFRGTPRMYASDGLARVLANAAVRAGLDQKIEPALRLFMYLPFAHSEALADQERSLELTRTLGEPHLSHAQGHHDIVERFGRFPHRNPILGRRMRPEEQEFLDQGGYSG
jgi:uncharacterized protein (DUF924 family)